MRYRSRIGHWRTGIQAPDRRPDRLLASFRHKARRRYLSCSSRVRGGCRGHGGVLSAGRGSDREPLQKDSYLAPFRSVERLDRHKIKSLTNGTIRAGFCVPERSVNTVWVADRYLDALTAEPHIEFRPGTFVVGANSITDSWNGPWKIHCEPEIDDQFDIVVNTLWEGRLAVDRSLGLVPEAEWSHRFRLSLFVETAGRLDLPCLVLATGPFGDVKNYDGHHFYLS